MGRGTEINFHLIGSTPPITDTSYNTSTKTWRPQMPISLTGFHTRVLGAPTFTLTGKNQAHFLQHTKTTMTPEGCYFAVNFFISFRRRSSMTQI